MSSPALSWKDQDGAGFYLLTRKEKTTMKIIDFILNTFSIKYDLISWVTTMISAWRLSNIHIKTKKFMVWRQIKKWYKKDCIAGIILKWETWEGPLKKYCQQCNNPLEVMLYYVDSKNPHLGSSYRHPRICYTCDRCRNGSIFDVGKILVRNSIPGDLNWEEPDDELVLQLLDKRFWVEINRRFDSKIRGSEEKWESTDFPLSSHGESKC